MYSMVLMVAMTAAPDATGFNGLFGRMGSSCHGSSCSGSCNGSSCYGSCSGYSSGCSGSCSGGPSYYGTTWGQSSYNCSGYGIYGGGVVASPSVGYSSSYPTSSCSGCCSSSGYNSCYGSGTTPYSSCSGYGIYGGGVSNYSSCYGSSYGMIYNAPRSSVAPSMMDPMLPMMPRIEDKKDSSSEKKTLAPTTSRATVTIALPADAKLFAQGQLTALTSARREFVTPTLNVGEDYQYDLRIEYTRDGQTRRDSKTVLVRAGQTVAVDFSEVPATKMERISSRVEVILPDDAKLFVNDSERVPTTGMREFVTPELVKDAQYVYRFRAEVTRDGKPESSTQIVSFKGGEAIRVDFSAAAMNRLTAR